MSLTVGVSVCPLAYLKNRIAELRQFFVHVNCGLYVTALRYVMYFRFCG